MKINKKLCEKCKKEISCSNYERHNLKCGGESKVTKININPDWWFNGKYKCPYCDKLFTKNGICSHILFKHGEYLNYSNNRSTNNLNEHNLRVKRGIVKHNKNQFEIAKENGDTFLISDETRKKIGLKHKGKKISKEAREKISLSRCKYLEEVGNGGFNNIKWYDVANINNDNFIVRGKWELEIANILNDENIVWIRRIYISYVKNGLNKTYTPDFYLPEYNYYLEVKGYFSQIDKEKIDLVISQNNLNLKLIFEKDLKKIREMGFKNYCAHIGFGS